MHLKRQMAPKTWPIPRKGTKYLVRPLSNLKLGVPILIALRDILKIAKNKKEVKKIINAKQVLMNGKNPKDVRDVIKLFDVLTLIPENKNYQLVINEHGKFFLEEISDKTNEKISKIIGKKVLKGKKTQLNLVDGINVLSDLKCKLNDSLVFNFKDKKPVKILELKEKANVFVYGGKHAGTKGNIEKIDDKHKIVQIKNKDEKVNVLIKDLVVVE